MPSSLCRRGGVLLLLALLVATTHGDDDNYAAPANCRRQTFICGAVNITYPFYLSSDTEPYCGYPGLAVRCDGGTKAVLRLGADNHTYTVSRIDYDNLTVSLADASIAAAAGTCPTVDHNVTVPTPAPGAPLFLRAAALDYLLFFLECSFGGPKPAAGDEPKPPKPPSIKPITCGGGGGSDDDKGPGRDAANLSFVVPRADVPSGDWPSRACRAVFEVPVLRDAVPRGARDDDAWRGGGYGAALRSGFQVGWERSSSGACARCEQGDGKCGYSRGGKFLACVCADGRADAGGGCSSKVGVVSDNDDYAPGTYVIAYTTPIGEPQALNFFAAGTDQTSKSSFQ